MFLQNVSTFPPHCIMSETLSHVITNSYTAQPSNYVAWLQFNFSISGFICHVNRKYLNC
jgi:hypothetical protein